MNPEFMSSSEFMFRINIRMRGFENNATDSSINTTIGLWAAHVKRNNEQKNLEKMQSS
jgi:hypothetical protein